MRSSLLPLLFALLTLDSVAQEAKPPEPAPPTSRPTSRPTAAKPATAPTTATGDEAALTLARKVHAFAGGSEAWAKVDNVVLTFVGRRRLLWDVRAGKVRIESVGKSAQQPGPIVYDINAHRALQLGDAKAAKPTADNAKGQWINDFYWLLVPLKVLDAGVALSIDARDKDDAEGVARLRLRFAAVGMTPDNEYVLHVEERTGRVVRWDFFSDAKAKPRSWEFAGYQQVGPLHLSLSRPMVGGQGGIELTDVAVNVELPDDLWTAEEPLLEAIK